MKSSITVFFIIISLSLKAQKSTISINEQEIWLNGGNVAWVNFAQDVGPTPFPESDFKAMFTQVQKYGANTMRLWVHTTGGTTPEWNGNKVIGPGKDTIKDLELILDMAEDHEIGIILCLWSFDMMRKTAGSTILNRSKALLESKELTKIYIENALIPMVEDLGEHPALLAWEIFNEPEGMSNEFGWNFTQHTPMSNIQRFINQTAGAIHKVNSQALVSNGAWSFHSLAKTQDDNSKNYYSDKELIDAGGDSLGVLDFYMVHYYEWGGTNLSPFHNSKDVWGLNKPVVVGEFGIPEDELFGIKSDSLYETLYDNGYAGALVWQWVDWYQNRGSYGDDWLRGLDQMLLMRQKYPNEMNLKFNQARIRSFEASSLEIESGGQVELTWNIKKSVSNTINGELVDSIGSAIYSPTISTSYELIAYGKDQKNDTSKIEINVLPAGLINRAQNKPSSASTYETCCVTDRISDYAFDGNIDTRWNSAWSDGLSGFPKDSNLDKDPDIEWIEVNLEKAVDVNSIVINWANAFASKYQIQTSLDSINWKTIYKDENASGGIDSIDFKDTELAKFLRMYGYERATPFGYSMWEFEVKGAISILQPPTIYIKSPLDSVAIQTGSNVLVEATAFDSDGTIEAVYFYLNGDSLGMDIEAPYTFNFTNIAEGQQIIYVKAEDNDGLIVQSDNIKIKGRNDIISLRLEAEDALLTGATSVQPGFSGASRGNAVYMMESGAITWDNLNFPKGDYIDLTVRYWLPFDYKEQYLSINQTRFDTLIFTTPIKVWQDLNVSRQFFDTIQTISIEHSWGYMTFDYLDINIRGVSVSDEIKDTLPLRFELHHNYPNPFNPITVLSYSLPVATSVKLDVYTITGKKVVNLVDSFQESGEYSLKWNAQQLASGIYIIRLQSDNIILNQKVTLVK